MERSPRNEPLKRKRLVLVYLSIGISVLFVCMMLLPQSVSAAQVTDTPQPTPTVIPDGIPLPDFPAGRRTVFNIRSTMYHHWMLTRMEGEKVSCHIYKAVIGEPTDAEVLGYCGWQVYFQWLDGLCKDTLDRQTPCTGLTLHYIGPINEQLRVQIKIPGALAFMDQVNCGPWGICDQAPRLRFGGYEPLHSEHIETVRIRIDNGEEYICEGWDCTMVMPQTGADGVQISFYVTSSWGDDSPKLTFYMRNIVLPDNTYLFQLIDTQWDNQIPTDAAYWKFFPPLTNYTPWLEEVTSPDQLYTEQEYALLAGVFILRGDVSAAQCADGGLLQNLAASGCGVEAAKDAVIEAQNRFDAKILDAAQSSRIPPYLLKGVIGQESQFWNGWVIEGEYGYGMMTDEGADLLLTWNIRTFLDLCIPAYGERDCAWGYTNMADYPRAYLRGQALKPLGTDDEFKLIGKTIAAAAGQAGQIIRNVTRMEPGDLMDYEEMWRISLAIYHGGSGCVGTAIEDAWEVEEELSWGIISEYLPGDCQTIASYPFWVTNYSLNP